MVIMHRDVKRKRKSDNKATCSVLPDVPKRTKVHAQRKFAQGANVSPVITPVQELERQDRIKPDVSPEQEDLVPMVRPHTEDFLTFLCFRGTSMLPPNLNFFNSAPVNSRVHVPPLRPEKTNNFAPIVNLPSNISPGNTDRPFIAFGVRKRADPILVSKHMDKKRRHALALQALRRKYQEQKMAKIRAITISKLSEKPVPNKNLSTAKSVNKSSETIINKKSLVPKTSLKVVSSKHVKVTRRDSLKLQTDLRTKLKLKTPIRTQVKKKMCLRSFRGRFIQHELSLRKGKRRRPSTDVVLNQPRVVEDKKVMSEFSSEDDQPLAKATRSTSKAVTPKTKQCGSVPKKPLDTRGTKTSCLVLSSPRDKVGKRKVPVTSLGIPFVKVTHPKNILKWSGNKAKTTPNKKNSEITEIITTQKQQKPSIADNVKKSDSGKSNTTNVGCDRTLRARCVKTGTLKKRIKVNAINKLGNKFKKNCKIVLHKKQMNQKSDRTLRKSSDKSDNTQTTPKKNEPQSINMGLRRNSSKPSPEKVNLELLATPKIKTVEKKHTIFEIVPLKIYAEQTEENKDRHLRSGKKYEAPNETIDDKTDLVKKKSIDKCEVVLEKCKVQNIPVKKDLMSTKSEPSKPGQKNKKLLKRSHRLKNLNIKPKESNPSSAAKIFKEKFKPILPTNRSTSKLKKDVKSEVLKLKNKLRQLPVRERTLRILSNCLSNQPKKYVTRKSDTLVSQVVHSSKRLFTKTKEKNLSNSDRSPEYPLRNKLKQSTHEATNTKSNEKTGNSDKGLGKNEDVIDNSKSKTDINAEKTVLTKSDSLNEESSVNRLQNDSLASSHNMSINKIDKIETCDNGISSVSDLNISDSYVIISNEKNLTNIKTDIHHESKISELKNESTTAGSIISSNRDTLQSVNPKEKVKHCIKDTNNEEKAVKVEKQESETKTKNPHEDKIEVVVTTRKMKACKYESGSDSVTLESNNKKDNNHTQKLNIVEKLSNSIGKKHTRLSTKNMFKPKKVLRDQKSMCNTHDNINEKVCVKKSKLFKTGSLKVKKQYPQKSDKNKALNKSCKIELDKRSIEGGKSSEKLNCTVDGINKHSDKLEKDVKSVVHKSLVKQPHLTDKHRTNSKNIIETQAVIEKLVEKFNKTARISEDEPSDLQLCNTLISEVINDEIKNSKDTDDTRFKNNVGCNDDESSKQIEKCKNQNKDMNSSEALKLELAESYKSIHVQLSDNDGDLKKIEKLEATGDTTVNEVEQNCKADVHKFVDTNALNSHVDEIDTNNGTIEMICENKNGETIEMLGETIETIGENKNDKIIEKSGDNKNDDTMESPGGTNETTGENKTDETAGETENGETIKMTSENVTLDKLNLFEKIDIQNKPVPAEMIIKETKAEADMYIDIKQNINKNLVYEKVNEIFIEDFNHSVDFPDTEKDNDNESGKCTHQDNTAGKLNSSQKQQDCRISLENIISQKIGMILTKVNEKTKSNISDKNNKLDEARRKKYTKRKLKQDTVIDEPRIQRPSRKTKEAATLYMEILGHKLVEDDFDDDDDSIDSFPELPNVRKMEQRENELKAMANSAKCKSISVAETESSSDINKEKLYICSEDSFPELHIDETESEPLVDDCKDTKSALDNCSEDVQTTCKIEESAQKNDTTKSQVLDETDKNVNGNKDLYKKENNLDIKEDTVKSKTVQIEPECVSEKSKKVVEPSSEVANKQQKLVPQVVIELCKEPNSTIVKDKESSHFKSSTTEPVNVTKRPVRSAAQTKPFIDFSFSDSDDSFYEEKPAAVNKILKTKSVRNKKYDKYKTNLNTSESEKSTQNVLHKATKSPGNKHNKTASAKMNPTSSKKETSVSHSFSDSDEEPLSKFAQNKNLESMQVKTQSANKVPFETKEITHSTNFMEVTHSTRVTVDNQTVVIVEVGNIDKKHEFPLLGTSGKPKRECTKIPQNYLPLPSSSDEDESYIYPIKKNKCAVPLKTADLVCKDLDKRFGKGKVNMSTEQIEKWLNESALAGEVSYKDNDDILKYTEPNCHLSLEMTKPCEIDISKPPSNNKLLKSTENCQNSDCIKSDIQNLNQKQCERKTIFHKERKLSAPNINAFSANNESSVYAFEADNEDSISTPFRRPSRRPSSTATSKSEDSFKYDDYHKSLGHFRVPSVMKQDISKSIVTATSSVNPAAIAESEGRESVSSCISEGVKQDCSAIQVKTSSINSNFNSKPKLVRNMSNSSKLSEHSSSMDPPTTILSRTKHETKSYLRGKTFDRMSENSEDFKYKMPSSPSASSSSSTANAKKKAATMKTRIRPIEICAPVSVTDFPPNQNPALVFEAPIFRPTEKEFQDPLEYIEKIRPQAERFGICRIIPPSTFKPECKLSDEMRFTAYNQYVHKMLHRWGPNFKEFMAITNYLKTQNIAFAHPPWIGGVEIDLPRLYQIVQSLGGLKEVIEKKKWPKVAELMRIPKCAQDRLTKLDDIYCKYLLPYDTLSLDEKEKLFDEVETNWAKRESRNLHKSQQKTNQSDSSPNSCESESDNEAEECIVKGRSMALNGFYRIARNTMSMWFKSMEPAAEEVEQEFWKHVAQKQHHICVHSGSVDSGNHGYGFAVSKNSPFARHAWNLKVLTNNAGSILRSLGPVMGVTVPTIHVGMVFSSCCWYRDPHSLPWIEYLHTGGSKIWYSIPDSMSEVFHSTLLKLVPNYCHNKSIWLPSDTVMVPPSVLVENGVSISRTIQEPGQFVVVFPKAFTSCLCTSYVVSESVYFASLSWLSTANKIFEELQSSCEPSMFSLQRLLVSLALDSRSSVDVMYQIIPYLQILIEQEEENLKQLHELGLKEAEKLTIPDAAVNKKKRFHQDTGSYECEICSKNLFISWVSESEDSTIYCLAHARHCLETNKIELKNCKLYYTYNKNDLLNLIEKVKLNIETKLQKKIIGKVQ